MATPSLAPLSTSSQKSCYQCGKENSPDQSFCGGCGLPLAFNDYIAAKVKNEVAGAIRDRDVLELDSAIKVFERAWGWIKLILGVAVGLLVLTGAGVFWTASDLRSSVGRAKQAVADTATNSSNEIGRVAAQSKQDISTALDTGKSTIATASKDAARQSEAMKQTTIQSKGEIAKETASFRQDLEGSRQQLQAAGKLEPEMETMRKQLTQATADIQAQQKVISSSEEFVKSLFSTHVVDYFRVGPYTDNRSALILPPKAFPNSKTTIVLLLLQSVPISATLQLQFHVFAQPQNSYYNVKNLVVFFWSDTPANLQSQQLSVSYFPDKSDKDIIHKLSEHDGRIFADDDPLPKFNQPDPDFKGKPWLPVPASARP